MSLIAKTLITFLLLFSSINVIVNCEFSSWSEDADAGNSRHHSTQGDESGTSIWKSSADSPSFSSSYHDSGLPSAQSFHQLSSQSSPDTIYSQRPGQQQHFSGSSGHNNNRDSENNQRPGQQQHSSGSFGHNQGPNQQQSSGLAGHVNGYHQNGFAKSPNTGSSTSRPTTQSKPQNKDEGKICYNIVGCFSTVEPWKSTLRPVPAPLAPENNSAVIYFYSRPHTNQRYLINLYPVFSLGDANFDSRKPTVVIIHGFIQDGNEIWMEEMKNAYLRHVDANAMLVDWGSGARKLSYLQASGNALLIGRMVANLVKSLMKSHGADPGKFHLIGHSLGAHVASYAAKEVPGIGRLTALDPAQPGFEGFDKKVRLDKSDAEFVDVVHTNAKPFIPFLGLGMIKPHGHVDFYMNGGFDQPLCVSPPKNDLNRVKSILDLANLPVDFFSQTITCDHGRAHSYMTEAFNEADNCVFWGHKATVKNVAQTVVNAVTEGFLSKFVALSSKACTKEDCIPMGFGTKESPHRGTFVVTTNGKSPYCTSKSRI